jgi:hypothetical protein
MIIFLKMLDNMFSFNSDDIISQDGFLKFCDDNNICFIKTDFFYLGKQHMWRGNLHPTKIDTVCFIGHSDHPIVDEISQKFDKIFCINRLTKNSNTFGIPLGITSDCDDTPIHRIYGNKEIMVEVHNEDIPKNNLVYLNFSLSTYPQLRQSVYNKFGGKPWVKIGDVTPTIKGRKKYLQEIKSSKFVLCPRGNGIDTHRIWESLYMGSIPIVIYEDTHHLFTDLPILFIDDWDKVTYDFLNEKYEEMTNKEWSYNKLKMSYWENFIKEEISKIK